MNTSTFVIQRREAQAEMRTAALRWRATPPRQRTTRRYHLARAKYFRHLLNRPPLDLTRN